MNKRTAIPKAIRFEVFKRDAFTCQYCGAKSPDVALHVDHIKPVSKGGENEIINLITACQSCNSGKSDIELDDDTAIQKQRAQLDDLNERREQLQMMMEWRESMKDLRGQYVEALCKAISDYSKFVPNESGKKEVVRWLGKFSFAELLEALTTAFSQYIRFDEKGEEVDGTWGKAFEMVPRIARMNRDGGMTENMKAIFYIRGILRNRLNYLNELNVISILKDAASSGADMEIVKDIAKASSSWSQFVNSLDYFMAGK